MTYFEMLLKNIRAHARRYLSFFLCNSFAIMVLFMYFILLFNRKVQKNLHWGTRDMMMACMIAIIVFIFGFLNYAYWTFVKSRNGEFGLFGILGMTRKDMKRLVLFENVIIVSSSLVAGLVSGSLFSRLFFMTATHLLQKDFIRFEIGFDAYGATFLVFTAIFAMMNLIGGRVIKRLELIDLLKQGRKAEKGAAKSILFLALGLLMILSAYLLKFLEMRRLLELEEVSTKFVLILFPGLYIFIYGLGGRMTAFFRKRPGLYYPNMLSLVELNHKLARNRAAIYLMCILSALAMFFMGDSYTKYVFGFSTRYYEADSMNAVLKNDMYPGEGMLLLFVSGFLAVLFFVSACCVINFKLFNEIDQEKERYQRLFRVGITGKETGRYLSTELKLLFFMPLITGMLVVYPFVVIENLSQNRYQVILGHFSLMILVFAVLQTGFYFYTKSKYLKRVIGRETL